MSKSLSDGINEFAAALVNPLTMAKAGSPVPDRYELALSLRDIALQVADIEADNARLRIENDCVKSRPFTMPAGARLKPFQGGARYDF